MYTKIVQIKILYDNECTKHVHQIPTYIQKSTNCTKLLYIQTMYKVHKTYTASWNDLYMFFVHTKWCTNYTKPIQLANWNDLCMFFVHTNNVQTIQDVYKC